MMCMCFCSVEGVMEFYVKGKFDYFLLGYMFWFVVFECVSCMYMLVCGYWLVLGLCMEDKLLVLDIGCLWGGKLIVVWFEDCKVF